MKKYLGKRLLTGLLTIIVAFVINFIIINLAPGDPIKTLMGKESDDPVLRAALEEKYGLNKPLHMQFFSYLKTAMTGDLGTSIIYNRPVTDMIVEKLPATILLVLTSAILSLVIGTAMGIMAGRMEGTFIDVLFSGFSYILNAMPSFWLGLMLIIIFSSMLNILPTYGMTDPRASYTGIAYVLDVIKHMILPVTTLVLIEIPIYYRIAKSSILQVTNEDFILTLRATGMDEKKIFRKYIFRNAILPTVTIFGISLAYLITGVSLIETVFAWPGTGRLVLTAITQRDYPTLMGMYLIMSISIALMMIVVDIVYAILDPRIRY
ncbi:ABC transporter permease [Tepidimicrobium xylanilyticum]|uniref:Peptide/nickel transport system permease protein n=1 Tax=Tepidimicrobium xylanilyticum TaxID=1123352 RepID=A0A1H2Q0R0_9FIRM|nr:ABC transporter permease [Tepidimicrobium xylanilyticum]GMG95788.1 peptide transporter [Tepidimicrobium xylanilyticum]SDW00691.1 peptide/nickel transport system permease protein [Tepidimicrobium xylanilyticum]